MTTMAAQHSPRQILQLKKDVFLAAEAGKPGDISQILSCLEPELIEEILHHATEIPSGRGTPLTIAAERGHLEVVQLLVEHFHVQCDQRTNTLKLRDVTALMCAASCGHLDVVKYLVTKGSDINLKSCKKETPLCLACRNGMLKVVKYLVESGARVEDVDNHGPNILMVACDSRNEELVQYLLDMGADFNGRGYTLLRDASRENAPEIVKVLLKNGATFSKFRIGLTPLLDAADCCHDGVVHAFLEYSSVTQKDKVEALELLGAKVAERDLDKGFGYLHQAMVERYRDPSAILTKPQYPPSGLIRARESQTLEELEALQFDPDLLRLECLTIIERILGWEEGIEKFLDYVKQLQGAGRYKESFSLLLHAMKNCLALRDMYIVSVWENFLFAFRDMIDNGLYPLFSTVLEVLNLTLEMKQKFEQLLKWLSIETEEFAGFCLQYILVGLTVAQGQEEGRLLQQQTKRFVHLLPNVLREAVVSYWSRLWVLNSVQYTPFDLLVSFLIQCGADVNAMDNERSRPLHDIARLSLPEDDSEELCCITRVLVEAGALVGVRNSEGKTPLDIAATEAVAAILREHCPVSLKSLAASAVVRHRIPYAGEIPRDLEEFVQRH